MAPPRKILPSQLHLLLDFLEEHKDLANVADKGPVNQESLKHLWAQISKKLNLVPKGTTRSPVGWKQAWHELKYRTKKKVRQGSKLGSLDKSTHLTDIQIRVLSLLGQPFSSTFNKPDVKMQVSKQEMDSDSDQPVLQNLESNFKTSTKKNKYQRTSKISIDHQDTNCASPPPRWALDLEERRIAAEERIADALESMATIMQMQEKRRAMIDERMLEALTSVVGNMQELNSGVQDAVHHLKQIQHLQLNGTTAVDFLA